MNDLQTFTAVAVATVRTPASSPRRSDFHVAGVAFLSVIAGKAGLAFDFAARPMSRGQDPARLRQWLRSNLPGGLLAGYAIEKTELFGKPAWGSITDLHRKPARGAGSPLIRLNCFADGYPETLTEACAPWGFPTDTRHEAQAASDYALGHTAAIERALATNAVASVRLAVALAARELRGGDVLQAQAEGALLDWLRETGLPGTEMHLLPLQPRPPAPPPPPAVPAPPPEEPAPAAAATSSSTRPKRYFL